MTYLLASVLNNNPASAYHAGVNTYSPTPTRLHGPLETMIGVDGSFWVYAQAAVALSIGVVGIDQTTTPGQNTAKVGVGCYTDKAVPINYWYWFRDLEMGIGPADHAAPSITIAAGASNTMTINVQWHDASGNALNEVRNFRLYFSDAASGAGLTASTFSGTLVATAGAVTETLTAKKDFLLQTNGSGLFTGTLTDTGKTATAYTIVMVGGGLIQASAISGTNWG